MERGSPLTRSTSEPDLLRSSKGKDLTSPQDLSSTVNKTNKTSKKKLDAQAAIKILERRAIGLLKQEMLAQQPSKWKRMALAGGVGAALIGTMIASIVIINKLVPLSKIEQTTNQLGIFITFGETFLTGIALWQVLQINKKRNAKPSDLDIAEKMEELQAKQQQESTIEVAQLDNTQ